MAPGCNRGVSKACACIAKGSSHGMDPTCEPAGSGGYRKTGRHVPTYHVSVKLCVALLPTATAGICYCVACRCTDANEQ
jgi:hypothetical protein